MDFQANKNLGDWLKVLNGKIIDKIHQVDFNHDRHGDNYRPWLFWITFLNFDRFLEVEGDFDGDHIRINFYDIAILDQKIQENHFPNAPDLWSVYDTQSNEKLGLLLGQKIEYVEFGIDKDEFEINGSIIKGQKDLFNFIRFNCKSNRVTIFEGCSTGLGISDERNVLLDFAYTFNTYSTK